MRRHGQVYLKEAYKRSEVRFQSRLRENPVNKKTTKIPEHWLLRRCFVELFARGGVSVLNLLITSGCTKATALNMILPTIGDTAYCARLVSGLLSPAEPWIRS